MSKNCARIVLAFLMGQIVQIVLAVVAKVSFMSKPILFCGAAGFLFLIAVYVGIRLAKVADREPRTYMDYANGRFTGDV